ncbi:MAG: hypothetical protein ACKO1U_00920, partial [Bacteroidota bacterium]
HGFDPAKRWPVTILLDPHAEAMEVVSTYQSVADKHGQILVGSLDFKNGLDMERSNRIVSSLLQEATGILHADPSAIHLMGFSGGAKAAIAAATSLPGISMLTYCGAAFPQGAVQLPLPTLGIAGIKDMNFTEVLNFTTTLDTTPYLHAFFVSESDHSWPDTAVFELTMGWADAWRCRNSKLCDSLSLATDALLSRQRIAAEKDLVRRDLLLHFHVAAFHDIVSVSEERDAMSQNQRSADFRAAMGTFVSELDRENKKRQELAAAFTSKDLSWWKPTIRALKTSTDPVSARLADYCSLAAYSYSRSSIDAGEQNNAAYFIDLYQLVDPDNSEWAYLRACLCEQGGDRPGAIRNLNLAFRMGMKDPDKIRQEKWLTSALSDAQIVRLLDEMDQAR